MKSVVRTAFCCWLAATWLVALPACAPASVSMSGKVTLDGAPIEEGTISLVPMSDGLQKAGWATISQGQYSIPATEELSPGKYRVEIRALRAGGKANANDPTLVVAQEAVPS